MEPKEHPHEQENRRHAANRNRDDRRIRLPFQRGEGRQHEDVERDRIYLPQDELERFGIDEEQLRAAVDGWKDGAILDEGEQRAETEGAYLDEEEELLEGSPDFGDEGEDEEDPVI